MNARPSLTPPILRKLTLAAVNGAEDCPLAINSKRIRKLHQDAPSRSLEPRLGHFQSSRPRAGRLPESALETPCLLGTRTFIVHRRDDPETSMAEEVGRRSASEAAKCNGRTSTFISAKNIPRGGRRKCTTKDSAPLRRVAPWKQI